MGAAFLVALREGIEAALIVSILLAYLRRVDRTYSGTVWWGAGRRSPSASPPAP